MEIQGKDRIIDSMKSSLERSNREYNDLAVKYNEIGTRSQKLEGVNAKLLELLETCQSMFTEEFEGVLHDSLKVLKSRKDIKRDITKLVENCAAQILQSEKEN